MIEPETIPLFYTFLKLGRSSYYTVKIIIGDF